MKNMTKVLTSIALSGSLLFSTLGDSASARDVDISQDGKYLVFKTTFLGSAKDDNLHHESYLLSDTGRKMQVTLTEESIFSIYANNTKSKKASFNVRLSNNKRLKIKNGLVYSKGKIYTGTMSTKKAKIKGYTGNNVYYWNKLYIRKGHIYKGTTYVKRIPIGSQPG